MTAVVYDMAAHRQAELVSLLRGMLAHAERGELRGHIGEYMDMQGNRFMVASGPYKEPGAASDFGFRLQMKAAHRAQRLAKT